LDKKRAYARKKKEEQGEWEKKNPELAAKYKKFMSGELPAIDYAAIAHKANLATRVASADVLAELAKQVENMIISSADLSNSDKTDGFMKGGARAITKNDFGGAFLQAGVTEFTMAVICNGIALHGGIWAGCGTFFVFSDYMKPAVRMSALMELPVKYIWSHDAFRVGEDGPTHQPIEHEAQIRLMEKVQNHSHKMSLLALRPADSAETNIAWKMAMENTHAPTALILSRQNINDLPERDASQAEKGAYVAYKTGGEPKIILIASGSEVSTLIEAAKLLKAEKNIDSHVISVISEGLFRQQPKSYQESIIPASKPKYGLTAGLSVTLEGLVGENGTIHGVNHFGYSAPAKTLDEKFGFTGKAVYEEIVKLF
jgi:transketolase